MSLPSTNANGQSSIRNFFQPKSPSYAPPPAATQTTQAAPLPPPPPPPPPSTTKPTSISPPSAAQNGSKLPVSAPPISTPTRPPSLHPQATISPILPEYIPALRRITSLLLPVNYPDSFYERIQDPLSSGAFSRVLLWTDDPSTTTCTTNAPPAKVIGGLVCRPEPSPFHPTATPNQSGPTTPDAQTNALYIQSLVLLSPYRHLGLASALLEEVTRLAAASPLFACRDVFAHVWTDNDDGLRWYWARGFARLGVVQGYYYKLRPDSALIVRRQIGPASVLGLGGGSGNVTASNGTTSIPPSATAAAANLLAQTQTQAQAQGTAPQPQTLGTATLAPPPLSRGSSGPSPNRSPAPPGQSYQNARPQTEWNDLPADMQKSAPGSSASSRSSSVAPRKKRDRAYPVAAFGK
ncbi:hypothetical protein GGR54DRAFT_313357 [Hypoxylon sp. NC1633]|nr:hypothetical protein GGR54DRAFT_313357 [Hypoxylon sp. NC1633]